MNRKLRNAVGFVLALVLLVVLWQLVDHVRGNEKAAMGVTAAAGVVTYFGSGYAWDLFVTRDAP